MLPMRQSFSGRSSSSPVVARALSAPRSMSLHAPGVRRRSSTPLSTVLEINDDDEAEEEASLFNGQPPAPPQRKPTTVLLPPGKRRSSALSALSPGQSRRRSSNRSGAHDKKDLTPQIGSIFMYASVVLTVMLGPQIGWQTSQLNLARFHKVEDCAENPVKPGHCIIFPGHTSVQWIMAVMGWVLGAAAGSLGSSIPAERFGRRWVIIMNATFLVAGGTLQMLAPNIYLFALGRFFNGIASGAGSTISSVYLTEIAPPHLRAGFVVAFQATGSMGLVAVNIVHFTISGSPNSWRWMMAFPAALGAIQLLFAPFVLVESPKWLLANRRKLEAAAAFQKLYKSGSFEELELAVKLETERSVRRQILQAQESANSQAKASFWRDAWSKRCSKQFTISCILCIGRQFGGVSAVFYYSSGIFANAGIKDGRVGNLILAIVNVLAVGAVCIFMKKLPRRIALLGGIGGMIFCSIGMTMALLNKSSAAVPLTAAYVGFNSLSLSPLPFLVAAEVLPEQIKTTGISFTTFINWVCNLIVGICFPVLAAHTGDLTFVPFTGMLVCFWLSVFVMLPETKDKTVEQIQLDFRNQVGFFDKFKKIKSVDVVDEKKEGESVPTDAASAATIAAEARRTSVEYAMSTQPPRPNFSRSA